MSIIKKHHIVQLDSLLAVKDFKLSDKQNFSSCTTYTYQTQLDDYTVSVKKEKYKSNSTVYTYVYVNDPYTPYVEVRLGTKTASRKELEQLLPDFDKT